MLQKVINKNLYNKKANISIIKEEKGNKDQIKKTQKMLDELNNKILGKIDIDSIHELVEILDELNNIDNVNDIYDIENVLHQSEFLMSVVNNINFDVLKNAKNTIPQLFKKTGVEEFRDDYDTY
ncbi:hypothetical protein J6W34_03460 [bacterium]|nr:hypothetical protein [bacterium]